MKATNYQSIILHIPHSSSTFPAGSGYSLDDLSGEERLLIDYHTDSLFLPDTWKRPVWEYLIGKIFQTRQEQEYPAGLSAILLTLSACTLIIILPPRKRFSK